MARNKKTRRRQAARTPTIAVDRFRLLSVVDELDAIAGTLQLVPELTRLAALVHGAHTEGTGPPDEIAKWAREQLAIDLDGIEDEHDPEDATAFPDLGHVGTSAEGVLDAARWRLRRVGRLLALVARQDRNRT